MSPALVRSPVEHLVGLCRTLRVDVDDTSLAGLSRQGQVLFDPPDVDGWTPVPDGSPRRRPAVAWPRRSASRTRAAPGSSSDPGPVAGRTTWPACSVWSAGHRRPRRPWKRRRTWPPPSGSPPPRPSTWCAEPMQQDPRAVSISRRASSPAVPRWPRGRARGPTAPRRARTPRPIRPSLHRRAPVGQRAAPTRSGAARARHPLRRQRRPEHRGPRGRCAATRRSAGSWRSTRPRR